MLKYLTGVLALSESEVHHLLSYASLKGSWPHRNAASSSVYMGSSFPIGAGVVTQLLYYSNS